jgi:ketosteroid isomerase-like protein
VSRENVDAALKGLDAFNRRDKAAWLAVNDPEVEAVPPRDWPESDPIRGREAVWDFYVENIEAFREGVLENTELIEVGHDKVVGHVQGEMQGKTSGASVAFDLWTVGTYRDGQALRVEWFAEREQALAAVGLRE